MSGTATGICTPSLTTLFRSPEHELADRHDEADGDRPPDRAAQGVHERADEEPDECGVHDEHHHQDRKSTRLNSSHSQTSYAVFCLKKKTCIAAYLLVLVSQG